MGYKMIFVRKNDSIVRRIVYFQIRSIEPCSRNNMMFRDILIIRFIFFDFRLFQKI